LAHNYIGNFLYFSLEVADIICIIRASQGEKKMSCPDPLYDYEDLMEENEGWDPIMGDSEDMVETDDEWLDDFQGEEDFA
jgi:hypothetical protein